MNPDTRRTVLVLGGRGRLGTAAATAFRAAGWRVWVQARSGEPQAPQPGRIDVPLHQTRRLAEAAAGASVVVYAVNPPYTEWETQMLPLARAGMAVAEQLGATFMLPGNVYAFGEGMPALLREDTPEAPTTQKGRLRRQLEAELAERAASGSLKSAVIRGGDFFGAAEGTWIDQLIAKQLAQRKPGTKTLSYPGPFDVPHAWAYLPDLARAFVAVAATANLPAHTRLHFEGHTLTGQQLLSGIEQAARELGIVAPDERVVQRRMRWLPVRLAGLFMPSLRELARMSYLYRVPHALDGRALQALAGPLPHTPLHEALRVTVAGLAPSLPRPAAQQQHSFTK